MARIYIKTGNKTSEEKKYIKGLRTFLEKNPETDWSPAKNLNELKNAWEKHCVQDVEFTETSGAGSGQGTEAEYERELDEIMGSPSGEENNEEVIDPFTEKEPVVREHVFGNSTFSKDNQTNNQSPNPGTQSSFSEPTDFKTAFQMPGTENSAGPNNSAESSGGKQKAPPKEPPLNPEFANLSSSYKNKKTRRMAKNIVNAFCFLLREGVPAWATRDITPEALAEAAKKNEINLDVVLTFSEAEQVHILEYFKNMCEVAKTLGDIPPNLQEELTEDLYDLLLEKGITPSPTQSFLLTLGEILLLVGIKTYGFRLQISAAKSAAKPEEVQVAEEVKEQAVAQSDAKKEAEDYMKENSSKKSTKNRKASSETEGEFSPATEVSTELVTKE